MEPDRIVAVDIDAGAVADAANQGFVAIRGNATNSAVLDQAGVRQAKAVIIAPNRDDTAVLATLTVREINTTAHIVAGGRDQENLHLLRQGGADEVIDATAAVGRMLGIATKSPGAIGVLDELLEAGSGLELVEVECASPNDLPVMPDNASLVSVVRNGRHLRPDVAGDPQPGDASSFSTTATPDHLRPRSSFGRPGIRRAYDHAMTGAEDTIDHEAFEAQCRAGIESWIAEHLGGEVVAMERLERWRPQWKVSYTSGGETGAVLVRGNRPIAPVDALRFEMACMQILERNGILVPHIHGWMDEPVAFVMDWVETEDRAPGMLHTAMDTPSEMDPERWQATLGYMAHLAAVHAVPVSEFADVKQLANPPSEPRDIALHAVDRMYAMGEMAGNIDPSLSFLQMWLRRNAPTDRHDVRFLCGDAGQFMSRGTDVVALLDLSLIHI